MKIFAVKNHKDKEEKQNLILIGIKGNPEFDETKSDEYIKFLNNEIVDFTSNKDIVTDDFAPVGN